MRDIQCRQVHQLEWAEPETHLILEDAVDGREISYTLAGNPQCFGAVAPAGVVDDKAGGVLGRYRGMTELMCEFRELLTHHSFCLEAGDHFHHPHQRNRVEEVKACQASRALECRPDGRHRQGRGVGGQDSAFGEDGLQVREQFLFDIQALDDRLHHQIT